MSVSALVTVVIPVYNGEATIVRAVESVLAQTYRSIEIIVIDDGSTDGTAQVLQPYLSRIRYVYQENQERSAARNHGLRLAEGEYIAFLDADDGWLPEKVAVQIKVFAQYPSAGLVSVGRKSLPEGQLGKLTGSSVPQDDYKIRQVSFAELVCRNWVGSPSQVMVRQEVLQRVGGFDINLHQGDDWELWCRIAIYREVVVVLSSLTYYQLPSEGEVVRLIRRNACTEYQYIVEKLFGLFPIQQDFDELQNRAKGRVFLQCALMACADDDLINGEKWLTEAVSESPDLFVSPLNDLKMWLIEYAKALGRQPVPVKQMLAFVDKFQAMVSVDLLEDLMGDFHILRGELCASRLFTAYSFQDWREIKWAGWYALRYCPAWGLNFGFLSIWLRSFMYGFRKSHERGIGVQRYA